MNPQEDFPVSWVDDHYVTRRDFTRSLVWVSCSAAASAGVLMAMQAAGVGRSEGPPPQVPVGRADALAVGTAALFHYPGPDDPCLLIRLEEERFVAFSQKCTHLGCPVLFRAAQRKLYCPCHEGFFDAADGRVLAGPPPRPLPRIKIERRGEELWAVGWEDA